MPSAPVASDPGPAVGVAADANTARAPLAVAPPPPPPSAQADSPAAATSRDEPQQSAGRRAWTLLKTAVSFLIEQWFVLGIGIVILLAHFFPNVGRTGGAIKAEYTVKYMLIAIIFFISGLSLPLAHLYARAKDWRLHIVTHATSFLLFPSLVFGIVSAVHRSDPDFEKFDRWALAGMVVLGCVPTTVSSNVVMTGQAGGDQSAATIEVMLGNLVGTFLSPALLQMFMSTSATWSFGAPNAGPGGTGEIYRQVIQQLGLTVFVPLFVGEVVQWLIPKFVKRWRLKLKLAKFASLCLLGVIWSTFCNAFWSGAFEELSTPTILLVLFVNILLYVAFSAFLFLVARILPMPRRLQSSHLQHPLLLSTAKDGVVQERVESGWWEEKKLMDGPTTVALLFCGAAKGIVLGAPIVNIMYSGLPRIDAAKITIPLVLYQGSQVVLGQVTVSVVRAWMRRVKAKNERLLKAYGSNASDDIHGGEEHTLVRAESEAEKGRTIEGTPRVNALEKGLEHAIEAGEKRLP